MAEVNGQPIAQALVEGVTLLVQEAQLEHGTEPFGACARLDGEPRARRTATSIRRSECTLVRPLEIEVW